MGINKILLFIIASISLTSCISLKHGKRIITKDLSAKSFVIYESDKVELWFDKEEIFASSKKYTPYEKYYLHIAKMIDVNSSHNYYLALHINTIMKASDEVREVYSFFMEAQNELMQQGKVKVFNKSKNRYEKIIYCKRVKIGMGDIGNDFRFRDGTSFFYFGIGLGE
jgi:hypothetical protein